jgi:hypothetical protein
MYAIFLNKMEGVELILKALRKQSCIASQELAVGIQANLHYAEEGRPFRKLDLSPNKNVKPNLVVLKGNRHEENNDATSEGNDAV